MSNNKLIAIVSIGTLLLTGCNANKYDIEDNYSYHCGYVILEADENMSEKTEKLEDECNYIMKVLTDKEKINRISLGDKSIGEEEQERNSIKYGVLCHLLDRLNTEEEKGLEGYYLETIGKMSNGVILDDVQVVIDKYENQYGECINKYYDLFKKIENEYNGETINEEYIDELNKISAEFKSIKAKIGQEILAVIPESLLDMYNIYDAFNWDI